MSRWFLSCSTVIIQEYKLIDVFPLLALCVNKFIWIYWLLCFEIGEGCIFGSICVVLSTCCVENLKKGKLAWKKCTRWLSEVSNKRVSILKMKYSIDECLLKHYYLTWSSSQYLLVRCLLTVLISCSTAVLRTTGDFARAFLKSKNFHETLPIINLAEEISKYSRRKSRKPE